MTDRPPILMVRHGTHLIPMSPFDATALEKFRRDKALKVRITQGRSEPQLRLYWQFLDLVADNLDQNIDGDDLHEWLKLKLGFVKPIRLANGEIAEVPVSIALEKMEQAVFNAYFDAVKAIVLDAILPNVATATVLREASAMLGLELEAA